MTPMPAEASLDAISLKHGAHGDREQGMCAMEAVAWLAGEPHSDSPKCACRAISAVVIRFNDRLPTDELRDEYLKPLIPQLLGSASTEDVYIKRGYVAADFAVRVIAPLALEAAGKTEYGAILRGLAQLVDKETCVKARDVIREWYPKGRYYYWAAAAAADAAADARAKANGSGFVRYSDQWYAVYNKVYVELYTPAKRRPFWDATRDMIKAMLAVTVPVK